MTNSVQSDQRIKELLERFNISDDDPVRPLKDIKREIYQYGKRRCDVEGSRDNLVYHLGAAFEANSALNLDSLALTGILSIEIDTFSRLFTDYEINDDTSLVDLLRVALENPDVFEWARKKGAWLHWKRLEAAYVQAVTDFQRSDAFHRTGWRRRPITRAQRYLIGEICRLAKLEQPKIANRGQAFEFIRIQGGNPRFWVKPQLPEDLSEIQR